MSDWFLQEQINIKFCVKSGKNASDTCTVLSETCGGEAAKISSVFRWHSSKRVMRTWQAVEEMVVQDLSEPVETVKTCRM
jgi:hypothetical protein